MIQFDFEQSAIRILAARSPAVVCTPGIVLICPAMQKVLVYSPSLSTRSITSAVVDREVETVGSVRELAESVLAEKNLACVLVEVSGSEEKNRALLESLKRHFPVMVAGLVAENEQASLPEGYARIDIVQDGLAGRIDQFVSSLAETNRRGSHRFDWSLQAYLRLDSEPWQPIRLRSLSSSGAYLECAEDFPDPETIAKLRVVFHNFKMITTCEIMSPRHSSSNLPPGFGIRFTGLSEVSRMVIERLVHSALVDGIVDPGSSQEIPSLGDDDLLTESFEQL